MRVGAFVRVVSFVVKDRDQRATGGAIPWWLQLLVFLLGCAAVVSRRPDALFNPQFFAEDGSIWYPEAYMFGWFNALLHPQNGYFQTLPRLVASLALLVPLADAPLVMNLAGIALQVLPVCLLLSSRCRHWGPLWVRAAFGAVYLALPNAHEVHVAIEEGQWHLGLVSAIVVLAAAPTGLGWRVFDTLAVTIGGLSGPFGVVLVPFAALMWWRRREGWRLVTLALIIATAAVQLSALLLTAGGTRPGVGLGASFTLFVKLLGARVFAATLLGEGLGPLLQQRILIAGVALAGSALVAYCLWKARWEVKLAVGFACLIFAASLRNPMVSLNEPQWQVLFNSPGVRYFFFPTLGFAWVVAWCATSAPHLLARLAGVAALLVMSVGIYRDWRYPAYPDLKFPSHAHRFDAARPGSYLTLPIYPPGWEMRITKKTAACRTLPFGWLDGSATSDKRLNTVRVSGWVIAYVPIRHVTATIDGGQARIFPLTVARPDVDAFYPQAPVPIKGFDITLDTSSLPAGPHNIELRAVEVDGCDAAFAAPSFVKEP